MIVTMLPRRLLIAALLATGASLHAHATLFDFTTIQTSSGTPSGPAPYARLTVLQQAPNVVSLRLDAPNLGATEFISKFEYNIDGAANTVSLLTGDNGSGGVGNSSYAFNASTFIDASLSFDASVTFPTSNANSGARRFKDGESFTFSVTRPGLTVDDIDLSMMIHIQGISPSGSAKVIAVPHQEETAHVPDAGNTLALLGLGAAGLVAFRRR